MKQMILALLISGLGLTAIAIAEPTNALLSGKNEILGQVQGIRAFDGYTFYKITDSNGASHEVAVAKSKKVNRDYLRPILVTASCWYENANCEGTCYSSGPHELATGLAAGGGLDNFEMALFKRVPGSKSGAAIGLRSSYHVANGWCYNYSSTVQGTGMSQYTHQGDAVPFEFPIPGPVILQTK